MYKYSHMYKLRGDPYAEVLRDGMQPRQDSTACSGGSSMAAEKHKFGFRKWGGFTLFYILEKYSQSGVTPNSSAFVGQFTYSMIYTLALIRA